MNHAALFPPTLETRRLRLRAHRPDDFADCIALWADPIVIRHTTLTPSTEARTWARMLTYLGLWSMLGYGYWAVEEKSSGKYIGDAGFADFKRELEPSIAGIPELGWALAPRVHGQGYATEALRTALVWGEQNIDFARCVCLIHPENLSSLRVAEKIGFASSIDARSGDAPVRLFSRPLRGV